jgi:diguanylate cyclase (GGDEF)-like protein
VDATTGLSDLAALLNPMVGAALALVACLVAAAWGAAALWLHSVRAATARRTRELHHELIVRHRAESDLYYVRGELESLVRERTQVLEARNLELDATRQELQLANEQLRRLVGVDALTGIPNRRHFDESLARELERAARDRRPVSLILADIDGFKRYNDAYGHAAGDRTLRQVAQALSTSFRRGSDLAARYGGEEFAVILPGVDQRHGSLFAERLRRIVWRLALPHAGAPAGERVTISLGVATVLPEHGAGSQELIVAADAALYRAKFLGRNRHVSAPSLAPRTVEHVA